MLPHHTEKQTLQQSHEETGRERMDTFLLTHLFQFADCIVEIFSFFLHLHHLLFDCIHLCSFSLNGGGGKHVLHYFRGFAFST